jgi:hypothetical protein
MKKIVFVIAITFFAIQSQAQLVQGELKIKEQSKIEIEIKGNKAVNLYAAFRDNNYPIHFIFTGIDIPQNSDKKDVVQFVFSSTIKKDGKVLGNIKRTPIPFFPGDMLMPVETFDFISMLSNLQTNPNDKVSEIPSGNYEITLEAKPLGVKGTISSVRLFLKIN